jgi:hypothetical protein
MTKVRLQNQMREVSKMISTAVEMMTELTVRLRDKNETGDKEYLQCRYNAMLKERDHWISVYGHMNAELSLMEWKREQGL